MRLQGREDAMQAGTSNDATDAGLPTEHVHTLGDLSALLSRHLLAAMHFGGPQGASIAQPMHYIPVMCVCPMPAGQGHITMWEFVRAGVNPIDQHPPTGRLYGTKVQVHRHTARKQDKYLHCSQGWLTCDRIISYRRIQCSCRRYLEAISTNHGQ